MLSIENPPSDLLCSNDERASDDDNNNNHQFEEVDLLKSGLDDNINSLPKFSIRDYVFSTRGKDIKNNWPFSQKNLQLCLKHGVKDVLPPFQSLDSVRNPSIVKCADESLSCSDVKLSELSNRSVGQNVAVDIENINSSGSEENKEFPSTTTSQSCSDINSIFPVKSSAENPKVQSNIAKNTAKRCRLIVKLNNTGEQKPNEGSAVNTSVISETMASKVCPVCKTFSSSSNTTLNAHIDQCLCGDSTIKWTANSKVIKHRIKPRKTRMMVDIYETALHGTLEDLDKRNGTNWASNLGFPAQDLEACAVEKKKQYSSVNIEDKNEDGAVYIDSNGTKLRILSKLSDLPSNPNASYDCGPSKLVERDEGNKFLSSKKKKHLVRKQKLLNHCVNGQGSYSPGPNHFPEPEVNNGQRKKPADYEDLTQPFPAYDPLKSDDSGIIKPWVGSKRTGLRKRIDLEHEKQQLDRRIRNSKIKSRAPSLGNMQAKKNTAATSIISSDENPLLPSESHKRKETLWRNPHDGEFYEQPRQRKRPEVSLLKSKDCRDKNNHVVFSKFNAKQSRYDSSSVHECRMDPPFGVENQVYSRNDEKMEINMYPSVNNDRSFGGSRMSQHRTLSSEGKEFSSGSKKFSSLRKKLLHVRHGSTPESDKKLRHKRLDCKRSRLGQHKTLLGKCSGKSLMNKTRISQIQKRGGFVNADDIGDVTLAGSETSPKSDSHRVEKNNDSLITSGDVPQLDTYNVEMRDEFVYDPSFKLADGEAFTAFSKSLDCAFQEEMFSADKVGEELITDNRNYYVDVDPIPIPGPPGSFLPSPGRMCSEELQGNSSLTMCKMQSSEDEREVVADMDSSDSPISAMSVVSNAIAPRSSESLSVVNLSDQREINIHEQRAQMTLTEVSSREFKNVEPCSCSRKDGSVQIGSLNYVESQLLRRRAMMADDLNNKRTCSFELRTETLHQKEPALESEQTGANSQMGYAPLFQAYGDCESPSPSISNPVLRLMGKNLMVVNKDENSSPQTRLTQSRIEHSGPWICVDNGISTRNYPNEPHSFHRILSGGPSVLDNMQTRMPAHHFDFNSSDGFKIPANFSHPSTVTLSSKSFGGSLNPSSNSREYAGECNSIHNQFTQTTYDIERVRNPFPHSNTGSKLKEIIVIDDDSPESDSRRRFQSYENRGYPVYNGSPIFQNGNSRTQPYEGMNYASVGKSSVMHTNSVTASLPSTVHLRSSLYFSPGFS